MTYEEILEGEPYIDLNDAEPQQSFDNPLPKGEIVKVRMTIKAGGHKDERQGWTDGYATYNPKTGSVYLDCEFVVLEGPYAKRKIWSKIGLHSPKGPEWSNIGKSLMLGIVNSARGLSSKDESPEAMKARRIRSHKSLDGMEFVARVGVETNPETQEERNVIKAAVTRDQKAYARVSVGSSPSSPTSSSRSSWGR